MGLSKVFIFASIAVPFFLYFLLPIILERFFGKGASRTPLLIACLLFFIAWYLPSPDIGGRDTAFMTHAIGGGVFTGFLWLYVRQYIEKKLDLLSELGILYFLVSGLGVANELFEFAVVHVGLARLDPSDTWWDFVANTAGMLAFWVTMAARRLSQKNSPVR